MMNRKIISITVVSVIVIVVAIATISYLRSFHTVRISLADDVAEAAVVDSDNTTIETVRQSTEIRLQSGNYTIKPTGDNIDTDPINLRVDQTITVTVDPPYSNDFLASTLKKEQPAIDAALKSAYPLQMEQYIQQSPSIFGDGSWYASVLRLKSDIRAEADWYRVILHNNDGRWSVAVKPSLVITAPDHPDIPMDILRQVNKLQAAPSF